MRASVANGQVKVIGGETRENNGVPEKKQSWKKIIGLKTKKYGKSYFFG
jgi:hypothetical protein